MKRLIIASHYSSIESLGIMCLATVAKVAGWEVKVCLAKGRNFEPVIEEALKFGASLVAFSVWTGYHLQIFSVCSKLKSLGIKVAMGGPHVTYFASECQRYSNWAVKGEGFRIFRRILEGLEPEGICFDPKHLAEGFPMPDRESVYERYPEFAESPIKSVICSLGCPFSCSYCYNSLYKKIYNGFSLNVRPVDDVVEEVLRLQKRWPLQLVYFQDDIFGFNLSWLSEFAKKWKEKVGVPWHCQIRLELTKDERRLDLFKEAGCTGITVAIESGNEFLRRFVLLRHMSEDLIFEGVRRIKERDLALRTEQILAVPFSDIETDLETLKMNISLKPEIAWTSILVPYVGTEIGNLASNFGFYNGNNDELSDSFFDRSILRHIAGGPRSIKPIVLKNMLPSENNPLCRMKAVTCGGIFGADVCFADSGCYLGKIEYLSRVESEIYRERMAVLQRCFVWFAKIPAGELLAGKITGLFPEDLSWKRVGEETRRHLEKNGCKEKLEGWENNLYEEADYSSETVPRILSDNPFFFCFFPSGGELARTFAGEFGKEYLSRKVFDTAGSLGRRWLYERSLYKIKSAKPPIAFF